MAKGIIYCMTTVVPGIIKIGKTRTDQFENRMRFLEQNGYAQVVGLKKRFAIEVEDYDEKETLIHELFSKSRVQNTELFAVNVELAVQLLSSLEGKQIYPQSLSKEEVFDTATDEIRQNNKAIIPNGTYILNSKKASAKMEVKDGKCIVLKGAVCLPSKADWQPERRRSAKIVNGILEEDVECNSPSIAGWVVLGYSNNGWTVWKTKDGEFIDIYRSKESEE